MPAGTLKGLESRITGTALILKKQKNALEDFQQRGIISLQKEHAVAALQMGNDSVGCRPRGV